VITSDSVAMPFNLNEKVRVIMHLPGGYTKVLVEWTLGVGMADGGIYWDIPRKLFLRTFAQWALGFSYSPRGWRASERLRE